MYFSAHQFTDSVINQTVAGDGILAGKGRGDDAQVVVAAFLGAGVAGMAMRLVGDGQGLRLQRRQALAQQFDGVAAHAGRTFLNGLTLTFS